MSISASSALPQATLGGPSLAIPFPFIFLPDCANDCLPIILAHRYCSSQVGPVNDTSIPVPWIPSFTTPSTEDTNSPIAYDNRAIAFYNCFCNSTYILPLYTGVQCGFLCGSDSREMIIDTLVSTYGCGDYYPVAAYNITPPLPLSFRPPVPAAKAWWDKFSDGRRFGIVFGLVIAAAFVWWFIYMPLYRYISLKMGRPWAQKYKNGSNWLRFILASNEDRST